MSRRAFGALAGAKALLAVLLVVGAAFPDVGGFAGKGFAFRLPVFLLPAVTVPIVWRARGGERRAPYPAALDAGLTVPFLLDTLGNAVGLYDHWDPTDDVLHFVNWVVLLWGVTTFLARRPGRDATVLWLAGAGTGAAAIIGWELAEYAVMRAGVGGLHLTYADTLGDLALSTLGGALGSAVAVRRRSA